MKSASHDKPVAAMLWMAVTGLCFVGVQVVVKHVGTRIPPAESAFLRYVIGLIFLIPLWPRLRHARFGRRAWAIFTLRGAAQSVAVLFWFYAMTWITIAEVTAMNYMSPVYISIGAALFLGEPLAARRMTAIVLAFIGALIILRPGLRELNGGHLAMILVAMCFAMSYLLAKRMTEDVSPSVVVAMMSVMVALMLAPFALAVWVPPRPEELAWLFLVASLATAGHFCMTHAFRAAPMAVSQPVTFLQLVWAGLLGWLIFGEPVDRWVMTGGGLIMASVSFIAWREMRQARGLPPMPGEKG